MFGVGLILIPIDILIQSIQNWNALTNGNRALNTTRNYAEKFAKYATSSFSEAVSQSCTLNQI